MDASSILMSYLENGFDELPQGYNQFHCSEWFVANGIGAI